MCRRFPKCALVYVAFLVLLGGSATSSPSAEPAGGGTGYKNIFRVACVGDSITFGAGVTGRDKNSYPAVLGQWLGPKWDVRNFGVSGATLLKKGNRPYWKQQKFTDALQFKPDVVIIKLGTNDSKHPTTGAVDAVDNWQYKAEFPTDYKALIAQFRQVNPSVKIFTCLPVPAYPGFGGIQDVTIRGEIVPLTRQVAAESEAEVIDLYSALSGKPELFPDTVHPNNAGARLIPAAAYRALLGKERPSDPSPASASNVSPQ